MSLKVKELRTKTEEELAEMIANLKKEIKSAVTAVLDGSNKDTGKSKRLRRDVARIETVLNEKRILSVVAENESEESNA